MNCLCTRIITPVLLLMLVTYGHAWAQRDKAADTAVRSSLKWTPPIADTEYPGYHKHKERMITNYFYLQLSYPITGDNFGNPTASGQIASMPFTFNGPIDPGFKGGLSLGKVAHFLDIATPMVRLGVNVDFSAQAFGKGTHSSVDAIYRAESKGTYIASLGAGPQVTFKPIHFIQMGVYGRIGISGLYSNYQNAEFVQDPNKSVQRYDAVVNMYNFSLSQDLGIDITIYKLMVGLKWTFLKSTPGSGHFYTENDTDNHLLFFSDKAGKVASGIPAPIDRTISFNRISILLGIAL